MRRITEETAVLAKELGYPQEHNVGYDEGKLYQRDHYLTLKDMYSSCCDAPYQEELREWLEDKMVIVDVAFCTMLDDSNKNACYWASSVCILPCDWITDPREYQTRNEATDAALLAALQHLKSQPVEP